MTTSTVFPLVRARGISRVVAGLFLFGLSSTAAHAAGCGEPVQAGQYSLTFQAGGVEREAIYVIPSNYSGKKKVPLVLDFHGFTFTSWIVGRSCIRGRRKHWIPRRRGAT